MGNSKILEKQLLLHFLTCKQERRKWLLLLLRTKEFDLFRFKFSNPIFLFKTVKRPRWSVVFILQCSYLFKTPKGSYRSWWCNSLTFLHRQKQTLDGAIVLIFDIFKPRMCQTSKDNSSLVAGLYIIALCKDPSQELQCSPGFFKNIFCTSFEYRIFLVGSIKASAEGLVL